LSTRLVLDNGGNVLGRQGHLPFGEDFGESGTQEKHHFTSYERDGESRLDYALNRQYAQGAGRFNRVDPSAGLVALPQSLNRYAYVTNNPINATDPLGLFPIINLPPICPVVGGVAICSGGPSVDINGGGGGGFSDLGGDMMIVQDPPVPGTVPIGPIPPPPLPQPRVPQGSPRNFVRAMNRAFADLESRLRSRQECADLFGGLENALNILAATEYRFVELPGGNATQRPDGSFAVSGAQTVSSDEVQVNAWGPFLNQTLLVTTPSGVVSVTFDFGTGLSGSAFQSLILLHELGHQAGVFQSDAQDSGLNAAQTQQVYDACFR